MGLRLFNVKVGAAEVVPRLAQAEADVQGLVEAHMEKMLGVTFLASEYVIDCIASGRIDSLGLDENGAPVIAHRRRRDQSGPVLHSLADEPQGRLP